MSEHDVLGQQHAVRRQPVTRASLAADLKHLGLRPGAIVLVHTSLSRLGWVLGGPQTVIEALLDCVGGTGTLMMPTHSMQLTDPQHWRNPPVPQHWWPTIRQQAPVFDTHRTPTRDMGSVAELFRNQPGALRSAHPHGSFAALGKEADTLVHEHALEDMFGEASPLGALYHLDGYVLLLGVTHANNTSLHLAENRAELPHKNWEQQGARLVTADGTQWVSFKNFETSAEDFDALGEAFARDTNAEQKGDAGWGEARLMRQRAVVDYGQLWLQRHR